MNIEYRQSRFPVVCYAGNMQIQIVLKFFKEYSLRDLQIRL
jgi:hypothetical protein